MFDSWDGSLNRWSKGTFCMEETLSGGACVGDVNNDRSSATHRVGNARPSPVFEHVVNGDLQRPARLERHPTREPHAARIYNRN